MGSATVGTIVITGVIVAVLAVFLITIGLRLQRLSFTLGTIIVGLRAIREQTRPIGPVLDSVVGDVSAIEGALGEVLAEAGEAPVPAATVEPEPEPAEVVIAEVDVLELDGEDEYGHGVQATQAGYGVQATQAGDGVQATQAGYGVQATQAGDGEDEIEYEYDGEDRVPAFDVPTRARRGGSGFAEAMARAGGRTPVRR